MQRVLGKKKLAEVVLELGTGVWEQQLDKQPDTPVGPLMEMVEEETLVELQPVVQQETSRGEMVQELAEEQETLVKLQVVQQGTLVEMVEELVAQPETLAGALMEMVEELVAQLENLLVEAQGVQLGPLVQVQWVQEAMMEQWEAETEQLMGVAEGLALEFELAAEGW